jgi:hypothetical protein
MSVGVDTEGCEPIGTHGLIGKVESGMVTIAGPCGDGHVMNTEAAVQLWKWLGEHILTYGGRLPAKQ